MSSHGEIDSANCKIDLVVANRNDKKVGSLTGRASSWKEQQLSKSLAETSINKIRDDKDDFIADEVAVPAEEVKVDTAVIIEEDLPSDDIAAEEEEE